MLCVPWGSGEGWVQGNDVFVWGRTSQAVQHSGCAVGFLAVLSPYEPMSWHWGPQRPDIGPLDLTFSLCFALAQVASLFSTTLTFSFWKRDVYSAKVCWEHVCSFLTFLSLIRDSQLRNTVFPVYLVLFSVSGVCFAFLKLMVWWDLGQRGHEKKAMKTK